KFTTMAPVTGPYVGAANPIRTVSGGGLPWIITAGNGALKSDGHLIVHVRGLVLADQAPVPPALQGTNPVPSFEAIATSQPSSATGTATIPTATTAASPASTAGNSDINATVSLPHPCIAPIVFVFGAPNVGWFAATGGWAGRSLRPHMPAWLGTPPDPSRRSGSMPASVAARVSGVPVSHTNSSIPSSRSASRSYR